MMINMVKKPLILLLISAMCITMVSCDRDEENKDLWQDATYTEDMIFGGGSNVINVKVTAEDKSVNFIINTDKENLGDALLEHDLISGDQGAYGLYVKKVNGIFADYNTTKSYWSINQNGEYMMTGVDSARIVDGDNFEFVYTKE